MPSEDKPPTIVVKDDPPNTTPTVSITSKSSKPLNPNLTTDVIKDRESLDKAINASPALQTAVGNDNNNVPIIFPLNTESQELLAFQKFFVEQHPYTHSSRPLDIDITSHFLDPRHVISKMNFNMYWQFRDYQIQNFTRQLTERLSLEQNSDGEIVDHTNFWTRQYTKLNIGTKEQRIAYLERMIELFEGVSIKVTSIEHPSTASITKNGEILVNITEDQSNGLNNMKFDFPPNIINDPQKLAHAIELTIDQATRLLERSHDTNREIEIYGYKDDPAMVLRMYYSAILHDLKPTIDPKTIEHWENQKTDPKYAENLKTFKILCKLNTTDMKTLAHRHFIDGLPSSNTNHKHSETTKPN